MYKLLLIKRTIEDIFISPFILVGRIIAIIKPLKKTYRIYFFFPFYHTGGAEKVHAQIVTATGGPDCVIFITRKSVDKRFYSDFLSTGCDVKDISRFTDNRWLYFINLIYRGIVTGYINKQVIPPIVFNGQCNFGYKISPWVKKNLTQIELIHSFNSFSFIRIPFIPFISKTIMISVKRIHDHKNLYQRYQIPQQLIDRIKYIPNAIKLQTHKIEKDKNHLRVLYVGRGTAEKRIQLILKMADKLKEKEIQFEFLGDVSDTVKNSGYPFILFHGNIANEEKIDSIYKRAHILILTSETEGFPMVIMEAMSNGCVILATPVGDIPIHVKNSENGFLFSNSDNKEQIITEGIDKIMFLKNHLDEFERMSLNNIAYAIKYFGIDRFNDDYTNLLRLNNDKN